jgi:hypothetical protein
LLWEVFLALDSLCLDRCRSTWNCMISLFHVFCFGSTLLMQSVVPTINASFICSSEGRDRNSV